MLEFVYPFIIIIGFTSLAVALYFNFLIKKILKVLTLLLNSQINSNLSIKEYIERLDTQLKVADVDKIIYKLSYSKSMISNDRRREEIATASCYREEERRSNLDYKIVIKKDINDSLIKGYVAIFVKRNSGEHKIINSMILYIVTLWITNQIHSKIYYIDESFKKLSQLQTYIMHDLKNILQFFQLMQHNIKNIHTPEQKERFINHLKNSAEPINRKVNKILALLHLDPQLSSLDIESISLKQLFQEYVGYFKLNCSFKGDAVIVGNKEQFQVIADNILQNIHDKYLLDESLTCSVDIKTINEKIHITVTDTGGIFQNPFEICEAFYTTKQGGVGIGMYQVATVIAKLEGEIACRNIDGYPQTVIILPFSNI